MSSENKNEVIFTYAGNAEELIDRLFTSRTVDNNIEYDTDLFGWATLRYDMFGKKAGAKVKYHVPRITAQDIIYIDGKPYRLTSTLQVA